MRLFDLNHRRVQKLHRLSLTATTTVIKMKISTSWFQTKARIFSRTKIYLKLKFNKIIKVTSFRRPLNIFLTSWVDDVKKVSSAIGSRTLWNRPWHVSNWVISSRDVKSWNLRHGSALQGDWISIAEKANQLTSPRRLSKTQSTALLSHNSCLTCGGRCLSWLRFRSCPTTDSIKVSPAGLSALRTHFYWLWMVSIFISAGCLKCFLTFKCLFRRNFKINSDRTFIDSCLPLKRPPVRS